MIDASLTFDDAGNPVPVYAPPEPPAEVQLLEDLLDVGVIIPDPSATLAIIGEALDQAGDQRAAEALARMAARLDGTAAGVALRRVIVGDDEPLREAAERTGTSHVAIFKQEKRIRQRLTRAA